MTVELPHTGRARMIVGSGADPSGDARCTARIALDHPAVADGAVPAAVLAELGAQAAATLASAGAAPGRVVALKHATWSSPTVPAGVDLDVRVRLVDEAPPLRNYAFEVLGFGSGVVSVWLAPE